MSESLDFNKSQEIDKTNPEGEPRVFAIHYDEHHFGNEEKPIGTNEVIGGLTRWWEQICSEVNIRPRDRRLKNIEYFILELGKNILEHADGGELKVIFEKGRITVVATDRAGGIEDPDATLIYGNPEHGLDAIRKFADEFTIETRGRKFVKLPKGKRVKDKVFDESGETDIQQGSRVTFLKRFEFLQ